MKKRPKRESVQGTTCKGQIPLPNIHRNKGKYPLYGKELLNVISICAISHISQFYANKPKQYVQYAMGSVTCCLMHINQQCFVTSTQMRVVQLFRAPEHTIFYLFIYILFFFWGGACLGLGKVFSIVMNSRMKLVCERYSLMEEKHTVQ